MHAFSVDFVSRRCACCYGLRPLMRYGCTCAAADNRTQRFGSDTVALPATLLCSHRLLEMQRFLLPLVRRDVAERPLRSADKIALKGLLGNVF